MSVKRAVDSRTVSRDGFCRLLVKIALADSSKNSIDYSAELSRYLKDISIRDIGKVYDINASHSSGGDNNEWVDLEIPKEFHIEGVINRYVVRLILDYDKKDNLKFHLRDVKK